MIMEELLEPWYALTPAERAEKIREGLRRDWATGGGGHSCSMECGVPSGERRDDSVIYSIERQVSE